MTGAGLYGQHPTHRARSLLDGDGTQPQAIKLIPRKLPGEAETFAVVVHNEDDAAIVPRQFYHDMGSLRMLFYVTQRFAVNLKELSANVVGSFNFRGVNKELEGKEGFVAEAFGVTAHQVHEVGALNAKRAEVGDQGAQLRGFVLDSLLQRGKASNGLVRCDGKPAAEHV